MRNPADVLASLRTKACNSEYIYERLYRNLYNPEFFLLAYQNIYAKEGNMTAGTDGLTIDGMSTKRIDTLIASLKDRSAVISQVRPEEPILPRTTIQRKNVLWASHPSRINWCKR